MTSESLRGHVAKISVETVDQLTERDINELSDAAESAILSGGGFGWLLPPPNGSTASRPSGSAPSTAIFFLAQDATLFSVRFRFFLRLNFSTVIAWDSAMFSLGFQLCICSD